MILLIWKDDIQCCEQIWTHRRPFFFSGWSQNSVAGPTAWLQCHCMTPLERRQRSTFVTKVESVSYWNANLSITQSPCFWGRWGELLTNPNSLPSAELSVVVCDTPERAKKLINSRASAPLLKHLVIISPKEDLENLRSLGGSDINVITFGEVMVSSLF